MKAMKKFTREFKISVLRELENTKKIPGQHSAAMAISANLKQN